MQGLEVYLPWLNTTGVVGLLGTALWALVTGKVVTRREYDRLDEEVRSLRAQLAQLKAHVHREEDTH